MLKKYDCFFYPVTIVSDIYSPKNAGKIGALLTVEGGEVLEGRLSNLNVLYNMGVRLITLTWNFNNEIGSAAMDTMAEGGITAFGTEVIKEMNKLGIIIDVSHLSEKAFWDVIEVSSQPIVHPIPMQKVMQSSPQFKRPADKGYCIERRCNRH